MVCAESGRPQLAVSLHYFQPIHRRQLFMRQLHNGRQQSGQRQSGRRRQSQHEAPCGLCAVVAVRISYACGVLHLACLSTAAMYCSRSHMRQL